MEAERPQAQPVSSAVNGAAAPASEPIPPSWEPAQPERAAPLPAAAAAPATTTLPPAQQTCAQTEPTLPATAPPPAATPCGTQVAEPAPLPATSAGPVSIELGAVPPQRVGQPAGDHSPAAAAAPPMPSAAAQPAEAQVPAAAQPHPTHTAAHYPPAPSNAAVPDFAHGAVAAAAPATTAAPTSAPTAASAPAAAAAAAAAAAPAAAAYEQPELPEEKHPQKPTWRRGYQPGAYAKTEYLVATLTPSDCSTKRLRPPREWYDSLLGANFQNFVVGATAPDGTAVSFLLKAHAYEYVKAEYYVQGGETKRMFRVMGLQPGDALKLAVVGKSSGIATTRLTVTPAARNPHAAAILAHAAEQAAKREARLAANPKAPKAPGAARKRKKVPGMWDDDDDDEGYDGPPGEGIAAGRHSRQRSRKHFGDDFVSGLDEAWAAAQASDDDYNPALEHDGSDGERRRRRAGSRSGVASSGPGWLGGGAFADQQQQQQQQQQQHSGSGLGGAMPEVVATGVAEGRNVLRIKINRPAPPAPQPASEGKASDAAAAGQGGGSSRGRVSDPGCPLKFLAGLADGMGTPVAQQAQQGGAHAAAQGKPDTGVDPVMLLSKKLLRDDAGAVTGATCKFGWEQGSRSALAISRSLSQFGVENHESAAVETFDVLPDQCLVEVTLRLQAAPGRVDVLESAIVRLLDML